MNLTEKYLHTSEMLDSTQRTSCAKLFRISSYAENYLIQKVMALGEVKIWFFDHLFWKVLTFFGEKPGRS